MSSSAAKASAPSAKVVSSAQPSRPLNKGSTTSSQHPTPAPPPPRPTSQSNGFPFRSSPARKPSITAKSGTVGVGLTGPSRRSSTDFQKSPKGSLSNLSSPTKFGSLSAVQKLPSSASSAPGASIERRVANTTALHQIASTHTVPSTATPMPEITNQSSSVVPAAQGPVGILRSKTSPSNTSQGPLHVSSNSTASPNTSIQQPSQIAPLQPQTPVSILRVKTPPTGNPTATALASTLAKSATSAQRNKYTIPTSQRPSLTHRSSSVRTSATQRSSISIRNNGLMSAIELVQRPGTSVVDLDGGGQLRVASAPVERKRISFAPDVVGGAGDDLDPPKRPSQSSRKPHLPASSASHAAVLTEITHESAPDASTNASPSQSPRASCTAASTREDLAILVTEQAQRIAELESRLRELAQREAQAQKERVAAVKEAELTKKLMATDIKSVDALKTQLQEEHQTNASLIIFNRSLKTQVAELEGIIEGLLAQKGVGPADIAAVMAKIEAHKPVMPKIGK
ncbi:hypothetical protein BC830DRAFT_296105 [Chytriomyces sp. MP71]|nr:hypothetical protein BC830DRAFT_296105 [Chytriomyces sp. MP71]